MKVLIVEDETLVAMEIAQNIKMLGYEVCGIAHKPEDAYKLAKKYKPQIVIMDINLSSDETGVDIAKNFNRSLECSIIYLTAYHDKKTLEEVAQTEFVQYLIKPYSKTEFEFTLRLTALRCENLSIDIGNGYSYNPHSKELICNGALINLSHNERLLFHLLYRSKGNVLSFEVIDYEIWPDKGVSSTTLRTLIHRLRQKIPKLSIEKVANIGYRLS